MVSCGRCSMTGGYALAQAPGGGIAPPDSDWDEVPGDDAPVPSPRRRSPVSDLEKLWALPREGQSGKATDPKGPAAATGKAGRTTAEKSAAAQAEQLKRALAPKPPPEAVRQQALDGCSSASARPASRKTRSTSRRRSSRFGCNLIPIPQTSLCNARPLPAGGAISPRAVLV